MKYQRLPQVFFLVVLMAAVGCAQKGKTRGEFSSEINEGKKGRSTRSIRKIVASHLFDLRILYNRELRNDRTLKGKAIVKFEIAPSGKVTKAVLISSTLGSDTLDQAIIENISTWEFPPIPEEDGFVTVTYPFLFIPPSR